MLTYDIDRDELVFSSGKRVYCYGGNPSLGLYCSNTSTYGYGTDGTFYIGEISIDDAIELTDAMIDTWIKHKEFLLAKKES